MKILYAIVTTIRLVLVVLSMTVMYTSYKLIHLVKRHTPASGFALRRRWATLVKSILGISTSIKKETFPDCAIYASNHRNLMDPVLTVQHIDAYIVAKAELGNIPVLGAACRTTGIVFVKRENANSRSATLDKMRELLLEGNNVLIYPEGTTGQYETTKDYKLGCFRLAAELNIPIVPITIDYRDDKDIWNVWSLIPQFIKQFGPLKTYVKIEFGPAIRDTDAYQLMLKTKAYTDERLLEMHKGWSKMNFKKQGEPEEYLRI